MRDVYQQLMFGNGFLTNVRLDVTSKQNYNTLLISFRPRKADIAETTKPKLTPSTVTNLIFDRRDNEFN
ncbi:CLUMA_CG019902, isoform A [Clunio marinus]|uniref:CLUMA_CG019902, isoform A n=1 Tax=Clunio marinus TaxID=568069 RepID=A0A1J1J6I7_9DIPT|nr:CLUMA_CG019902, isoform A [Clunio marinus]